LGGVRTDKPLFFNCFAAMDCVLPEEPFIFNGLRAALRRFEAVGTHDCRDFCRDSLSIFCASVLCGEQSCAPFELVRLPEGEQVPFGLLEHFERHLGHKRFLEAITRSDIDDYRVNRCQEQSQRHRRLISPSTVNFEVGTLRTFFYYFINERELDITNPCTRFKKLRDASQKAHSRPPTYSQPELDALFAHCDAFEKAVFATLLLAGLRKRELYFLLWRDVDLRQGTLHVTGKGKIGFSPKGYEDRVIPLPPRPDHAALRRSPKSRMAFPQPQRQTPHAPVAASQDNRQECQGP
jgi:integrase